MVAVFAIEGSQIRVNEGLLELSIAGPRAPGSEAPLQRFIRMIRERHPARGVLCDMRDAEYQQEDVELDMRGRGYARVFAGLPVALLARDEDAGMLTLLQSACEAQGSAVRRFLFLKDARAWLREQASQSSGEAGGKSRRSA